MTIIPGTIQELPIVEVVEKGYLLGDEQFSVFIQRRELKPASQPGDIAKVFTFYNEERELEATTRLPDLQVGQVGCFRVGTSNELGAFFSIGTRRDILIPLKEQNESLEEGRMTIVVLCEDNENRRLFGSTKLNRHLKNKDIPYQRGDEVSLMIAEKIEIGRRVVVDGKYVGALFRQEMTDKVRLGEVVKGFIRKVEGKDIVVSMQREGMELLEDSKEKILKYLELNGGYVRLTDDTDPEEIKLRLHMSKKAFKKAAGMLYKEGKILLTKLGIKINKTGVVPAEWQKNKIFAEDEMEMPAAKPIRAPKTDEDDDRPRPAPRKFTPTEKRPERKPLSENRNSSENVPPVKKSEPRPEERGTETPKKKELTFKGKK
jgi:predicted RNA-binding protein (virulence factor B family)